MKNPKLFATCLIILFSFVAKAETINGPANFRLKPNGPVLFSLKDGEEIECGLLVNGWYKVSISVVIADKKYSGGSPLKKGTTLVSFEKKIIAVALRDIPEETLNASEGDVDIYGYVFKTNIKSNSIPEYNLDSTINACLPDLKYEAFVGLIAKDEYRQGRLFKNMLASIKRYWISENTITDPSPIYRIALYFENNQLIAIEHSRAINMWTFNDYHVFEKNKLMVIKPPKGLSEKQFVKKVTESYAGSD